MARLRDRENGCPWDIEQDYSTIAPHTIEEAYEVADAIQRNDMPHLMDELGDLLFQVVFHAQMAQEEGHFTFDDVVEAITTKMLNRHPHVFGDAVINDADHQTRAWEEMKAEERKAKSKDDQPVSALDGVTLGLPALTRALKLQNRAARVNFDWPDTAPILEKLHEELDEVKAEIGKPDNHDKLEEEIGDLLFVCVNLARKLGVEPEKALRRGNYKFESRFKGIEALLRQQDKEARDCDLAELDALWDKVKEGE